MVLEHHHSSGIHHIAPNKIGTSVVMLDDKTNVFLFDPVRVGGGGGGGGVDWGP